LCSVVYDSWRAEHPLLISEPPIDSQLSSHPQPGIKSDSFQPINDKYASLGDLWIWTRGLVKAHSPDSLEAMWEVGDCLT
jgi:hypothetical protein